MQFTFRELIYAHFYNVKILHVSWLIVQELYFFTSPLRQRAPRYAPYLGSGGISRFSMQVPQRGTRQERTCTQGNAILPWSSR